MFSCGSGTNKFCIIFEFTLNNIRKPFPLPNPINDFNFTNGKEICLYSVRILHKIREIKSQTIDCVTMYVIIYTPIIVGIFVPAFGSQYTGCSGSSFFLHNCGCVTFYADNGLHFKITILLKLSVFPTINCRFN